jgi:hypothetical protein
LKVHLHHSSKKKSHKEVTPYPYKKITDPDADPGGPKHADPADPDLEHWLKPKPGLLLGWEASSLSCGSWARPTSSMSSMSNLIWGNSQYSGQPFPSYLIKGIIFV